MTGPHAGGSSGTSAAATPPGQVPTNATSPTSGQVPGASTPPQGDPPSTPLTLEQALDALAKVRKEAADHRTRLTAFEKAQADAEAAKLSETEKLQKKLADLERAEAERTRTTQERIVRAEVKAAASAIGVKPDLAARLIDYGDIEFDGDGEPKNVAALLTKLVQTYPELAPAAAHNGSNASSQRSTSSASSGAPANPSRSATAVTGALSWDYINSPGFARNYADMTPERRAEVQAWVNANAATRPRT